MRTVLIAVLAALAVAGGVYYMHNHHNQDIPQPVMDSWAHWKQQYGRTYGSEAEEKYRLKVYYDNYKQVAQLNQEETDADFKLNKFADLTQQEFAKTYTGFRNTPKMRSGKIVVLDESKAPSSVNWVTQGAVADVKDQGQCGSCWAFSAVSSVESANYLQRGLNKVPTYSEQQLVDCAGGKYGNEGCNGGDMDAAFDYIEDHSLMTESNYPYKGKDGKCKARGKGVGTVSNYTDVTPNSPNQLKAAVAKQPVSIAVEADKNVFQFYNSGVITSKKCGKNLDHGVVAVGYGTSNAGQDYFLVRNSWGEDWGADGYLKISASSKNICGILSQPSYPKA